MIRKGKETRRSAGAFHKAIAVGLSAVMVGVTAIPVVPVLAAEGDAACTLQFGVKGISNPTPGGEDGLPWDGDYIYLGQYKQTLNSDTGDFMVEPIKWRVLDTNSSANLDAEVKGDTIYLMSDKGLDSCEYWQDENSDAQWMGSNLQIWLNDTFLSTAFTEQEQKALADTSGVGYVNTDPDMTEMERIPDVGGVKVFAPSASDLVYTVYGYPNTPTGSSESRHLYRTDYASFVANDFVPGKYNINLRSVVSAEICGCCYYTVSTAGVMSGGFGGVAGALPAIQLTKDQIAFSEPVEGEEGSWALTLSDTTQTLNVTSSTYKDSIATITYDGAVTGEGQQVSAIITDSTGTEILSYQKVADTTEAASGSGTVTLPEAFFDNSCKLYVFSEKEQAGVLPDYAGALQEMILTKAATPVEGITLDKSALSFSEKGEQQTLTAAITPADADNQKVVWTTSNDKVAQVSQNGQVTAMEDGTAIITVTTEDGQQTATCQVTVRIVKPVEGITLDKSALTFSKKGEQQTLTAAITPADADNQKVVWSTSNDKVAQVSQDGQVTAVEEGTATITVTTEDGQKTAACQVTVKGATPAKVSLTKVQSASYNSLKITWSKAANADGYCIYRSTSKKGAYKYLTQIKKSTTISYVDKSLTAGKTYYYRVCAYRTAASGNVYGTQSGIKSGKPVPATAKIKNGVGKKKQVRLTWSKVKGASGYQISYKTSRKGKWKAVTQVKKNSTTTYTQKKLKSGKTYYYRVRAYRTVNGKKVYGAYSATKAVKAK